MEETSKYIAADVNNKHYYHFDINKIWELFVNRADTYLIQNPDGSYIRVDEPLTPEIIRQHLEGRHTIAIYSLNIDSKAKWLCFDFDGDDAEEQAKKLFKYLRNKQYKNSMLVEHTGNRGYHVWIFFKPVKAEYLVWIGKKIAEKVDLRTYELFPKHTELNENIRFGDAVKLPFGIHRKSNKRSEMMYPNDLEEIVPLELPEEIQRKIQVELLKTETHSSLETPMKPIPWWTRCKVYETILKYGVPEGHRDESAFLLARIFRDQGLLEEEAFERLRQWNEKNSPPLDTRTLKTKIKQAYGKKYAVGFRSIIKNNILNKFCPPNCEECKYSRFNGDEEKKNSQEKERHRKILSLIIPKYNIILEAIGEPNGLGEYDPKFLIYESAGFQICDTYTFDNIVLEPKHPKSCPYIPYVINDVQAVKSRIELIELVYREVDKFIDAEQVEKVLFTAFNILTYIQELFETIPYLYLIGDNDSGKTHLLILMSHLCYRPMFSVSIPPADIYSYL